MTGLQRGITSEKRLNYNIVCTLIVCSELHPHLGQKKLCRNFWDKGTAE